MLRVMLIDSRLLAAGLCLVVTGLAVASDTGPTLAQTDAVLFSENFNGTWSTDTPPSGWTIYYTAPLNTDDWHRNSAYTAPCDTWDTPYASLDSTGAGNTGIDYLRTPAINCYGYSSIVLRCSTYFRYRTLDTTEIDYSTNGGATWIYNARGYYSTFGPALETIPLSSATDCDSLTIRWWRNGPALNTWALDNVSVTGSPIIRDVGTTAITAPVGTVDSGTIVTPQCSVYNYGNWIVSYNVRMRIGAGYDQVAAVTNHAPGTRVQVMFPNWTASPGGTLAVDCSTELAGDAVTANDRLTGSVQVRTVTVADVGCAVIVAPVGTLDSGATITPTCSVMNFGPSDVSYTVRMRIDTTYNRIATVTGHAVGTMRYITFPAWTVTAVGLLGVACSTECTVDTNPTNDKQVALVEVLPPPPWPDTWDPGEPMPSGGGRPIKDGGWLVLSQGGTDGPRYIFSAKGNKTNEFYRYDVETGLWAPAAPIPAGREGKLPGKGCKAAMDMGGYVYMTKGNNTTGFWRYRIAGDSWFQLQDVPLGTTNKKVKGGTDLAYVETGGEKYIYLLKGYKNEFWRFHIFATDAEPGKWESLRGTPVNLPALKGNAAGSWIEPVGSGMDFSGQYIYLCQAKSNVLFRYDVARDSWSPNPLAGMPFVGRAGKRKKLGDGGSSASWNSRIYALKGGNTCEFWRYSPTTDSWLELDPIPEVGTTGKKKRVKAGGDIVSVGSGAFFVTKGNKTDECWRMVASEALQMQPQPGGVTARPSAVDRSLLAVTPNPMRAGFATVRWARGCSPRSGAVTCRVSVYDATGRLVLRQSAISGLQSATLLDLRSLTAGAYVVRLDADGFTARQRLVIQR